MIVGSRTRRRTPDASYKAKVPPHEHFVVTSGSIALKVERHILKTVTFRGVDDDITLFESARQVGRAKLEPRESVFGVGLTIMKCAERVPSNTHLAEAEREQFRFKTPNLCETFASN